MLSPGQYTSKWSKWISLKLRHKEKNIKVIDDFELLPSSETELFLTRINAVSRKHNDTYAIFVNDLRSLSLIPTLTSIPEKVNFEGMLNNNNFILHSDTNHLPDRLFVNYINNFKSFRIDEMTLSLHKSDFLKASEMEILELATPVFSVTLPRMESNVPVAFLDARLQKIANVKHEITALSDENSQLACDFTNSSKGACTIQVNGKDVKKIYISGRKRLHFAAEIFLKPDAKSESLMQPERFVPVNYKITFDIKKTYWRYILISKSEERNVYDIKDIKFELNGEEVPTEAIKKTELVNGVRCLHVTFRDEMALRLNTFNHEIMKMKINSVNKWTPSTIRAPIPTYKNVQRTERSSGKSYSLLYVYI